MNRLTFIASEHSHTLVSNAFYSVGEVQPASELDLQCVTSKSRMQTAMHQQVVLLGSAAECSRWVMTLAIHTAIL